MKESISLLNIGTYAKCSRETFVTEHRIAMELKKAANHPYLFDGAEVRTDDKADTLKGLIMNSGKMVLLDKLLTRLRQDGHHVLIFSQMVRMLGIMADYMTLRGYQHQRLDGTVSSDAPEESDGAFQHGRLAGLRVPPIDTCGRLGD